MSDKFVPVNDFVVATTSEGVDRLLRINISRVNDSFIKRLNQIRAISGILTGREQRDLVQALRAELGLMPLDDQQIADLVFRKELKTTGVQQ